MNRALLLLLCMICGCSVYRERFTYVGAGGTNHVVDVSHRTCFMWGQAAFLKTETQTEEFIRSVNAERISQRPDAAAIEAMASGIARGIIKGAAP